MVKTDNLVVSANFDSSKFMGSFSVSKNTRSYDSDDNDIQVQYKLTFDEFKELELCILCVVQDYLKEKGKL